MLGERLRKAREDKGLTQAYVAKVLNISASTVGMYEQGRRDPDTDTLKKFAEIYECTTDYLLALTDEPNDVHQRIESALAGEPDADELIAFWREMKEREDLKLLFKQVRPLSDDSIRRVIRVIQAIELEESQE